MTVSAHLLVLYKVNCTVIFVLKRCFERGFRKVGQQRKFAVFGTHIVDVTKQCQ